MMNTHASIIDHNQKVHEDGISVLSYNILLPNSMDGWWVYKMYSHRHGISIEQTEWECRRSLLARDIGAADCDIVCLQEVCADSFDTDFSFMEDLGYDSSELYRKGRFRPATFWKSNRVCATSAAIHRDRCLILAFQSISCPTSHAEGDIVFPLYVVNCHLQAGVHTADRRLRQVHDCLDTVRKDAVRVITACLSKKRKKGSTKLSPEAQAEALQRVPVVLVGDTNCDPSDDSGAHALLLYGKASVSGKIDDESTPTPPIKSHVFGPFQDAYASVYCSIGTDPPPTMICEELYGVLTVSCDRVAPQDSVNEVETDTEEVLSPLALQLIRKMFDLFSSSEGVMTAQDVHNWLVRINGRVDRGSEMRAAATRMQVNGDVSIEGPSSDESTVCLPEHGVLTWDGFVAVYQQLIHEGKVWSVSYDLAVCGFPLPVGTRVYAARYDRIYVSPAVRLKAVRDLGVGSVEDGCLGVGGCLPNAEHPSDHLPIAAVVSY